MTAPSLMQSLLSLMLVIGAIFLLAFLLRRVQGLRPQGAGALRVHGGLSLGGRERVVWIEAGGRHLLVGVAPGRVNALHVFDSAPEDLDVTKSPVSASAPNFGELLKRALGR